MCGRYSLTTPLEALRALFAFTERPNLAPRVNIAPSQDVAAVRLDSEATGGGAGRHLVWLRWGLIPSWAKEAGIGNRMINARAETVADKPAFRAAFRRRRCLIPADGFYEWKTENGRKQPYRITRADGAPFAFAGLWERWTPPDAPEGAAPVESCAIVTTEANARLRAIHPRMPVILDPGGFETWLDPDAEAEAARALLKPYPAESMTAYRVSPKINSPANDDPALIAPLDPAGDSAAAGGGRQPRLL